jgi:hypothetical protein
VDIRRVSYPVAETIAALEGCDNPSREFAIARLRSAGPPG